MQNQDSNKLNEINIKCIRSVNLLNLVFEHLLQDLKAKCFVNATAK